MLTWKPFRADTPRGAQDEAGEQAGETDLLLDDVAGVEFSYFGVYDRSRPADWVAEWADPRSLPQLVRVRVTFPRGDPRRWPDLVIAPRFAQ
jgi:general secretion pathway protein J